MNTLPVSADWHGKEPESLLWLASFPRSGNTFARLLLANYFSGEEEPYDINRLHDFLPPDTSKHLWTRYYAEIPPSTAKEWTWSHRPRLIEQYRKLPKRFAGLKTHTANVAVFGTSGFDFRKTDRVVYIVRHPLDVALSYADFNGRNLDMAIETLSTSGFFAQEERPGGFEVRGSWAEHVRTWLNNAECPVFLVRYEELRGETEKTLTSMLTFLGAPIIPDRIGLAVAASQFDKLRAQEAANAFREAPSTIKSGTFFRKGTSFQWLKEFTPEQAYRLADACEPIMSELGYTHPRDVYFDGRNALRPVNLRA